MDDYALQGSDAYYEQPAGGLYLDDVDDDGGGYRYPDQHRDRQGLTSAQARCEPRGCRPQPGVHQRKRYCGGAGCLRGCLGGAGCCPYAHTTACPRFTKETFTAAPATAPVPPTTQWLMSPYTALVIGFILFVVSLAMLVMSRRTMEDAVDRAYLRGVASALASKTTATV